MYIYMYTYMHAHTHTHVNIYTHTQCIHTYICIYIHMAVHIYIDTYTYVNIIYIHTDVYTQVGALVGLGLFYAVGQSSIRTAYLLHCVFMVIGNIGFFLAAGTITGEEHFLGLLGSRAVIGLEGAVMYNASVALVQYSSPRTRLRYLAIYQFFVGLGLVLGPAFAAISLLAAGALGLHAAHAFVNLLIAVWGLGLGIALVLFLPDNDELELLSHSPVDEDSWLLTGSSKDQTQSASSLSTEEEEEHTTDTDGATALMAKMLAGNMIRITIRILWEAGSVLVLNRQFGFSLVNAALMLAAFGAAQTAAQLLYASASPPSVHALIWLEMVQLVSILIMFAFGLLAANMPDWLVVTVFLMTSATTYCANCLSSAPFNDILLKSADAQSVDREGMLLVSQVGIFLGFIVGPLSILSAMMFNSAAVDTLAAVLLGAWVVQSLLTSSVTNGRGASGLTALLGLLAFILLAYAMLDPQVGGTGADNLFSWHPIAMAMAFLLLMTWGTLVKNLFVTLQKLLLKPTIEPTSEKFLLRSQPTRAKCGVTHPRQSEGPVEIFSTGKYLLKTTIEPTSEKISTGPSLCRGCVTPHLARVS